MRDSAHALRVFEYERVREILASYAVSLGKDVARSISPLRKSTEIRKRLLETEEMRALIKQARLPLAGLRSVTRELGRATKQGQAASPELLYHVVELLRVGLSVRDTITRSTTSLPELTKLADELEDLPRLREEIPAKIDPREGVRDEATEKLVLLRQRVEELRLSLRARSSRLLSDPHLRKALQTEGVTVRNDRYLLPVKAEYRSWIPGPIRDRSQSESTLYIEPEALTLEGDRLLEALDAERDEVQRILWDLTRRVLEARALLERLEERLAWIDFTYAKASYAEAFGLSSPEINDAGILELREARHPYLLWLARDTKRDHRDVDLDAARKQVVPIDIRLGEPFKMLIVTGPNTGGKTVVLKTVGLNVLMALSGLPVAAAGGSRVSCYTNVFVDIGDEQSIEQNLSTFSSHLKQIMEVLAGADEHALILLDELGSGTDPIEGAALGRALLDKFRTQRWNAIITTHLGSLKEYAYTHDGVENAAMEFDNRSLKPTYRLLMGVPGSSNALAIARRIGLDPDVLQAAEQEMSQVNEPTREIISRMERSRRRVEKERRRAEKVRRKVQGDARVYKERLREVDDVAEVLQVEAQLVVDHAVREAKQKLTPLVEQLKNVPKSHRPLVDALSEELNRLLVGTPLGEKREAFARSLKKDDEVYVPKFRERAKVKKIDKGGRSLIVLLNGIRTEISFDDVSWLEAPAGLPPET